MRADDGQPRDLKQDTLALLCRLSSHTGDFSTIGQAFMTYLMTVGQCSDFSSELRSSTRTLWKEFR